MTERNYPEFIKSCGYRVFMRPQGEYCFYTDGTNIGYAQWSRGREDVVSVHKPRRGIGTGFQIANKITKESLEEAAKCIAPAWSRSYERSSVVKYKDWNEFHNYSAWTQAFQEV